jgi:endonuclease YncB( thermonuclease family)
MMRAFFISWIALACLSACAPAAPDALAQAPPPIVSPQADADLIGVASVVDGDTLEVRGERVRLYGMDAFESGQRCKDNTDRTQRCGQAAARALDEMTAGRTVYCMETGRDRWRRAIARCATTAVADLSAAMVEAGWALAFTRYSQSYVAHEESARFAGRGAWAGRFDSPAEWRAGRRTDASR